MISIRSRIGSVNRLILSWTEAAKFNRGVPCCPTEYFDPTPGLPYNAAIAEVGR